MEIKINKPKEEDLHKKGVFSWPIWEKEVSRFDWHYDSIEECYLLEGKVIVKMDLNLPASFRQSSPQDRLRIVLNHHR